MSEFLNFSVIGRAIPFKDVLDSLNVPYTEAKGEIKGQGFIVNKQKNLYFNPTGHDKGSVINFLSAIKGISLREAAQELKKQFLDAPRPKEIPEYELQHNHSFLAERGITPETAEYFELGYYGKRGIMAGKIAIKIRDAEGNKVAYIGRNLKGDNKYFFFKGYKHEHLYNLYRVKTEYAILTISPFDVIHIHNLGFNYAVGLLSLSMSKEQEQLLKHFKRILLLHPNPDNILARLAKTAFIKAPSINSVKGISAEEVKSFF